MIEALCRDVLDSWGELAPGTPAPQRVRALKWSGTDYPDPESALLFFLFADRSPRPIAVAKVARSARGDRAIVQEAEKLERARGVLPSELRSTMPHVVRAGAINGSAYLLATAAQGEVELHHTWGARRARLSDRRIARALDWCSRVAAATACGRVSTAEWLGATLEELLAAMNLLGLAPHAGRTLESRFPSLSASEWPAGLAHGDFFPGNIVFGPREEIAVVDWAQSEACAPSFFDPLTYELSFSLHEAFAGRSLSTAAHREVASIPAFASFRDGAREHGLDLGPGSDARLATALRCAWRDATAGIGRERSARAWVRILELEIGWSG